MTRKSVKKHFFESKAGGYKHIVVIPFIFTIIKIVKSKNHIDIIIIVSHAYNSGDDHTSSKLHFIQYGNEKYLIMEINLNMKLLLTQKNLQTYFSSTAVGKQTISEA